MRRQWEAADAPPRRGEHRIGDGGSDDGDADLSQPAGLAVALDELDQYPRDLRQARQAELAKLARGREPAFIVGRRTDRGGEAEDQPALDLLARDRRIDEPPRVDDRRSEEHTSELQSLMRISYAVFCLKKKI